MTITHQNIVNTLITAAGVQHFERRGGGGNNETYCTSVGANENLKMIS